MTSAPPTMLQAVSFDAFGTLIDAGRGALLRVSRAVVEDHQVDLPPERFLETWDGYFFAQDLEEFVPLAAVTEDSLARTFRDYGIDGEPRGYVDMLEREWQKSKPYPDAPPVLGRLDGLRRAVISNADDAFLRNLLRLNGLAFDVVVTSEAARCYKPHSRIFEIALEALQLPPEDIVHIGDSLRADVGGAAGVGMRTAWLNRGGMQRAPTDPRPDFEIRDLFEVPRVVEALRRTPRTVK